jgi:hypothetical protein
MPASRLLFSRRDYADDIFTSDGGAQRHALRARRPRHAAQSLLMSAMLLMRRRNHAHAARR